MNPYEKLKYFYTPKIQNRKCWAKNRNPHTGENALSIAVANWLKEKTLAGQFQGVWTKIANETSSSSLAFGVLMRNMGKNAGAADFIFTSVTNHLWLELKAINGKTLSPAQKFFKEWCVEKGCHYEVANSLEEAVQYLEDYGFYAP